MTAPVSDKEAFEAFVIRELGDIPVSDNGRYISNKIQKYWLTWQAASALRQSEVERLREALQELRSLISDDSYAITFQTFGQYRTALIKTVDKERRAALGD